MTGLSLQTIALMCDAQLIKASDSLSIIEAVSTNSREVKAHDLFIALRGERFDAHDFVAGLEGKVAAVLVDRELAVDIPQLVVDDTRLALGRLAAAWRQQYTNPVIGLTGSNGKTTLKEMTAAILQQVGSVWATQGNFNNDIGMPLTLLQLKPQHDYAVIEMGANHFGEIAYLTGICQPDVAVINNAGPAHLDGFGDLAGVAKAKGEIFAELGEGKTAVINADDTYADYWLDLIKQKNATQPIQHSIIRYGMRAEADVSAELSVGEQGENRLTLHYKDQQITINLPLLGQHNAMNALAASALSLAADASLNAIKQGLESMAAVKGRLAPLTAIHGARLIDDSYNANPASAKAGIDVLAQYTGKRIFVLGDMGELGEKVSELHAEVGAHAANQAIDALYGLGDYSAQAVAAFGDNAQHFTDIDSLIDRLKQTLAGAEQPVTVLVKGSRSMKMERVVSALEAA